MGKHKDKKSKKHKKEKKRKNKEIKESSNSCSSSEDEWVEKKTLAGTKVENIAERESWMSLSTSFNSFSNIERKLERIQNKRIEKEKTTYNPHDNVHELNPYWKDGGDGLPTTAFVKPNENYSFNEDYYSKKPDLLRDHSRRFEVKTTNSNWRKKSEPEAQTSIVETSNSYKNECNKVLSETEMNIIAAKLIKAEIMGNTPLIYELRQKLEDARKAKENCTREDQSIILTQTDLKGFSRPLRMESQYGEYSGGKKKKQKIETHSDGERIRYFPDDDSYSLQQIYENERFNSTEDENKDFAFLAGQMQKNDNLDDIFIDNIRKKESNERIDKKNRDRAIRDHQQIIQNVDNCGRCIQSENMQKHLMISLGETIYLSLPPHEPLTDGHCLIIPVRHVSCSTNLDENEWCELMNFRKALVKMYSEKNEDVIFFETAIFLSRHPHMSINCIPVSKEHGDLAPMYFKKAIDESETEWSHNKKLVSLSGRDVRKAIPKGLPYFSVSFGMQEGFAHVIEDQRMFPVNFGQEIIGGMLDLHYSKWKKPKKLNFQEQKERVLQFSQIWSKYDCTVPITEK